MERDKDYLGIAPDGLSLTLERLPESNRPFNLLVSVWSNYIVRDTNGEPSISRPFANEFYIIHPRVESVFIGPRGYLIFAFHGLFNPYSLRFMTGGSLVLVCP